MLYKIKFFGVHLRKAKLLGQVRLNSWVKYRGRFIAILKTNVSLFTKKKRF